MGTLFMNEKEIKRRDIIKKMLETDKMQPIDFRIAVGSEGNFSGGVNLFGKGCGDFDQDIKINFTYEISEYEHE